MLKKKNWIKTLPAGAIAVIFLSSNLVSVPAAAAAGSLKVTVGYELGDTYTKAEMTIPELEKTYSVDRQIYSWINSDGKVGTTEAEGIYLTGLMDDLGIDTDSVSHYHFQMTDIDSGADASKEWTPQQLLNTKYSMYPCFQKCVSDSSWQLSDFFNMAATRSAASFLPGAWSAYCTPVPPMIAFEEKSCSWSNGGVATTLDYSGISDEAMPQLLFGQAGMNNSGNGYLDQQIQEINVLFSGYPTVTVDNSDLKGKIGSECHVKVSVTTPDTVLTEKLTDSALSQIQWSSSNAAVAEVDENGLVTFLSDGTATITASYNGAEYKVSVTSGTGNGQGGSGGKSGGNGDTPSGDGGSKSGDTSGSGKGSSGDSSSGNNGTSGNSGSSANTEKTGTSISTSKPKSESDHKTADSGSTTAKESTKTTSAQKGGIQGKSQDSISTSVSGSGNAVKIYELKKDTVALPEIKKEDKLMGMIASGTVILIVIGAAAEFIYFRRQLK